MIVSATIIVVGYATVILLACLLGAIVGRKAYKNEEQTFSSQSSSPEARLEESLKYLRPVCK